MSSDNSRHGDNSLIPPARLSHAVLRTTRLEEMIQWYRIVLGAEVLYRNDVIAFLAYDHEHHRVALAAVPGLVERPKRSEEGLVSCNIENGIRSAKLRAWPRRGFG